MKEIALVYMVAGLSSRFGGKIKSFAKVGPNNETFIEYSLNQALPAGFNKIIFIVGKQTEKPFKEKFGEEYKGIPIFYALQDFNSELRDRPWGTLDALCSAKNLLDCPFVICSGDDLYGEKAFKTLVQHLQNNSNNATVGYKLKNVLSENGTVNRGVFEIDSDNNVISINEIFNIQKLNITEKGLIDDSLCSMLFFGFQENIMEMFDKILKEFKEKHKGDRKIESLLPVEAGNLVKQGKITMKAYSTDYKWIGLTNPEDEFEVKEKLKQSQQN